MFNKVTIIGTGLLGGSLAKDLHNYGLARSIVGVCRSQKTADKALATGLVDAVEPLELSVLDADLIVLATPMQAMLPIVKSLVGKLPAHAILTDVGSVKTDLYLKLACDCPDLLPQFVLAHPIAGGELSGVDAAKTNLFKGKHVVITDTPEVRASATQTVRLMWESLGADVLNMSLRQHDEIFAKTSHLPHVIAFSLVNFLSAQEGREQLFDMAAAGFYDFTRIASSDAEMWRDICITNREGVLQALEGFKAQLDSIHAWVADADQQAILNYFTQAKQARDLGLLAKVEKQKTTLTKR